MRSNTDPALRARVSATASARAFIRYRRGANRCFRATHPQRTQRMWTPEMVRAMTSRWISDVPSKIV